MSVLLPASLPASLPPPGGMTSAGLSSGANGSGLLAQLNSDYTSIVRADATLHDHLSLWLQHMEQWMHFQQHVFDQIQEHCHHMDIDTASLPEMPREPSDADLPHHARVNSPASSPVKPSPLGARGAAEGAPRLPAAVVMTSPVEGESQKFGGHERSQAPLPPPACLGDDGGGALRAPPSKAPEVSQKDASVNAEPLDISTHGIVLDEVPLQERWKGEARVGGGAVKGSTVSFKGSIIGMKDVGNGDPRSKSVAIQEPGNGDLDDLDDPLRSTTVSLLGLDNASRTSGRSVSSDDSEEIPKEHRMWMEVVSAVLLSAKKKKFYELREVYIQPEAFMSKVLRANLDVDFKILVKPKLNVEGTYSSEDPGRRSRHSVAAWQLSPVAMTNQLNLGGYHFGANPSAPFKSRDNLPATASASRPMRRMSTKVQNAEKKKCSIVLDPQAPSRLAWMALGMLLMLYDLIVLPMQAFPLPDHALLTALQWVGQIFWTLDIGVTFITAVYVNTELRTDFRTIAKEYTKTWFPFDVVVVAALWVVQIIGFSSSGTANAGIFRTVRMMRFLRLARLAKFEHYLQEALATINSSSLILCVGICKLMTLMIIISHLNACVWYAVGSASTGGWVDHYSGTSMLYRYLTSMHWAFTQFQGTSEILPTMGGGREVGERAYAVVIVMGALIILSSFVSSLTNMMMQLQALREERQGMARSVREYLGENEISKGLSIRVKKYIDWKQRMQRKLGSSDKVLSMLPIQLQIDLQEEVRGPMILSHRFFICMRSVHLRVFRNICHQVLVNLTPAPGEMVFSQQDHATRMFFMIIGISRYIPARVQASTSRSATRGAEAAAEDLRRSLSLRDKVLGMDVGSGHDEDLEDDTVCLVRGDYLCEAALWTSWEHCGSLLGVSDVQFVTVDAKDFDACIRHHPPAHVSAIIYARHFVAGLNKFGRSFNDIIDISTLAEEEEEEETPMASGATSVATSATIFSKKQKRY